MPSIHQEITFDAPPERIYEALMDSRQHAEFTANGGAEISRDIGGPFFAHGGHVSGRNIELVPNKRIVQVWHFRDWADGVYSIVRFELVKEGSGTRLILDHTGIPDGHKDHLQTGWNARYWEPLRKYLG
ncbi:MAG: SRPBCC family protein [Xanthobacteraceae bacterium]